MKLKHMLCDVYIASSFGRRITIRPELNETVPCHADMLRYDLAFHDPADPSRIIFPEFKVRGGTLGGRQTLDRWRSFCISLKPAFEKVGEFGDWISYQRAPMHADHDMRPVTVHEYLAAGGKS